MSWLWTLLAAALAAIAAGAGALGLSLLCVRWYHISSFEGKSGFFVAGMTTGGVLAGLVIGTISARIAAACGHESGGAQVLIALASAAGALLLGGLAAYCGSTPGGH